MSKVEAVIDEIEYIVSKLAELYEAQDIARAASPKLYRDLVKLNDRAFRRLMTLVHRVFRGKVVG